MKYLLLSVSMLFLGFSPVNAQEIKTNQANIYNPAADAMHDIKDAVKLTKLQKKHVLLQIGGNWCIWCRRFNTLVTTDTDLKSYLDSNYVVVHVNYSKENKNLETLAYLDYPQRFGYPVFIVLDGNGKRLHTQNSGYLEEGQGHSKTKVAEFLKQWSPAALNPKTYID
jgi:thioredoxin-related protein